MWINRKCSVLKPDLINCPLLHMWAEHNKTSARRERDWTLKRKRNTPRRQQLKLSIVVEFHHVYKNSDPLRGTNVLMLNPTVLDAMWLFRRVKRTAPLTRLTRATLTYRPNKRVCFHHDSQCLIWDICSQTEDVEVSVGMRQPAVSTVFLLYRHHANRVENYIILTVSYSDVIGLFWNRVSGFGRCSTLMKYDVTLTARFLFYENICQNYACDCWVWPRPRMMSLCGVQQV